MTQTSKPIIFFGTDDFSALFLTALIDAGYSIRAVVTKPDSKKGRGQHLAEPLVKTIATAHGIAVWQPQKLSEIAPLVEKLQPIAGALVSYGKIIPQSIIDLFTPGIINVHPSPLPRYRGPSPIESAIMNGDTETGVSIMQLSKQMDAGPVYSQVTTALSHSETKAELYTTLGDLGVKELLRSLPSILDGSLQPQPQDETQATYCQLLTKDDGLLDPKKHTAAQAEQRVRAFAGFPKTRLNINSAPHIITKAHIATEPTTSLDQVFADGAYLVVDELIAPSGKSLSAEAFLRGYSK